MCIYIFIPLYLCLFVNIFNLGFDASAVWKSHQFVSPHLTSRIRSQPLRAKRIHGAPRCDARPGPVSCCASVTIRTWPCSLSFRGFRTEKCGPVAASLSSAVSVWPVL